MARAQFPSSIGLSIGVLKNAATGVGDWAALLYALIRFLSFSAISVFGRAALVDTGVTFGKAPTLGAGGRLPASLVPPTAGGRQSASAFLTEFVGPEQAGVRWAELKVVYPSPTALQIGLKVTRTQLPATVSPVALGGPEIFGLASALNLVPGASGNFDFSVSDPDAVSTIEVGPETVATAYQSDSTGTLRRISVTAGVAGVATVTVFASSPDGESKETALVYVGDVSEIIPPTLTGQPSSVSVAAGSDSAAFPIVATVPGEIETFTATSEDPNIATAELTGTGTNRRLVVSGIADGLTAVNLHIVSGGLTGGVRIPVEVTRGRSVIPVIAGQPSGLTLEVGMASRTFTVVGTVSGPVEVFAATSEDANIATAALTGTGLSRSLVIKGVAEGETAVTLLIVSAGRTGGVTIPIEVEPDPTPVPVISGQPSEISVTLGGTVGPWVIQSSVTTGITVFSVTSTASVVATAALSGTGADRTLSVTPVGLGMATLTVTVTANGETATVDIPVTVTVPVPILTGQPSEVSVEAGDTTDSWTITSSVATGITAFSVATDDEAVATAELSGSGASRTLSVTGVAEGTTTLTVTVTANGKTATVNIPVTVTVPRSVLSGMPGSISIQAGSKSAEFTVQSSISEGISAFTVVSADTDVATVAVSRSGSELSFRVTGVATGSTKITATVTIGGESSSVVANVNVLVQPPATAPTIGGLPTAEVLLRVNTRYDLSFTVSDAAAAVEFKELTPQIIFTNALTNVGVSRSVRFRSLTTVGVGRVLFRISKDGASREYTVTIRVSSTLPTISLAGEQHGSYRTQQGQSGPTIRATITGRPVVSVESSDEDVFTASVRTTQAITLFIIEVVPVVAGRATLTVVAENAIGRVTYTTTIIVEPLVYFRNTSNSRRVVTASDVNRDLRGDLVFIVYPANATITVTNDNPTLFSTQPYVVDTPGEGRNVRFRKAVGIVSGVANVTVKATLGGFSVSHVFTVTYVAG